MNKIEEIVKNARSYIGKTEKPNNSGFTDPSFEKEMKEEGWQYGWAWCAIFAKVVYKNVFPEKFTILDKLFSASTVQTFNNFKKAGYFISDTPVKGALVIWQNQKNGIPQSTGHAGIVTEVYNKELFKSVEGNTNDQGGREGYIVAEKLRKVKKVRDGLQVLGFIKI